MNIKNYIIPFLFLFTGCATCKGVIGAPYDPNTHVVLYTLPGSPAELDGILPGDMLIRPELINGEPGTDVTVLFIRNGNEVWVSKLKRVCVDDLLKWTTKETTK